MPNRISFRLPEPLARKLDQLAAEQHKSVTAVILDSLSRDLSGATGSFHNRRYGQKSGVLALGSCSSSPTISNYTCPYCNGITVPWRFGYVRCIPCNRCLEI